MITKEGTSSRCVSKPPSLCCPCVDTLGVSGASAPSTSGHRELLECGSAGPAGWVACRGMIFPWLYAVLIGPSATMLAQPPTGSSMVVDDLKSRAVALIANRTHPASAHEAVAARGILRRRLEASLGIEQLDFAGPEKGILYAPEKTEERRPAVVVARPHDDPEGVGSSVFAESLMRLGFIVFTVDLSHGGVAEAEMLARGLLPQALHQRSIRRAFSYLESHPAVDKTRIGLAGYGTTAMLAVATVPDVAAAVVVNPGKDYKELVEHLFTSNSESANYDACDVVPGILQYAGPEELFALAAPRPLLVINPGHRAFDYAVALYDGFGKRQNISQSGEEDVPGDNYPPSIAWLAKHLQARGAPRPEDIRGAGALVEIPAGSSKRVQSALSTDKETLTKVLGEPLTAGRMSYGINCLPKQGIVLETQAGLRIPVTVLRPEHCVSERGVLVSIHDEGRAGGLRDPVVVEALKRAWVVWAVDPRGFGELAVTNESFVFIVSLLLGENFVWRQAFDVSRIVEFAGRTYGFIHRAAVYANGKFASLAAAYVAAISEGDYPEWVAIQNPAVTFAEAGLPPYAIPFGAGSQFDVAGIMTKGRRRVTVIHDVEVFLNGDWIR